jgi:hypothetical protein
VEEGPDIVFVEVEPILRGIEETEDVAMRDLDAFGLAGGAGSVDDVSEVIRVCEGLWIGGGTGPDGGGGVIKADDFGGVLWEVFEEMRLGEEEGSLSVLEHEGEAVGRVSEVDGEVGSASLEDAEQSDEEIERALSADADERVGLDAVSAEEVGELIGFGVELLIGEINALARGRDGLRAQGYLLFKALLDRLARGKLYQFR